MAASTNVPVENFKATVARFATLPIRDWSDHLEAQRYGEALASVSLERLQSSFTYALGTAASESGTSREQINASVRWDTHQELLENIGTAHASIVSAAEVEGVSGQLQDGIRLLGNLFAPTPFGQIATNLAAKGVGHVLESELREAVVAMQAQLETYQLFVSDTIQMIASTPDVLAAVERTESRRLILSGAVAIACIVGLVTIVWATRASSDASSAEIAPSAQPVAASTMVSTKVEVPDAAASVSLQPIPKRSRPLVQRSPLDRANCVKSCVAQCNDDSACEHSCVAKRCR